MDQLASIGVEFDEKTISRIFTSLEHYYRDVAGEPIPPPITSDDPIASGAEPDADAEGGLCGLLKQGPPKAHRWAVDPIFEANHPFRPWGLGAILKTEGFMYKLAGYNLRTPGMYRRVDPNTGGATPVFLEGTNERIHSSVRIRLALQGLGLNDESVWKAPALQGSWRLQKTTLDFLDPIPRTRKTWEPVGPAGTAAAGEEGNQSAYLISSMPHRVQAVVEMAAEQQRPLSVQNKDYRWGWEYCGPEKDAPPQKLMLEEPLGPFERQLLRLSGGVPNVYEYSEKIEVRGL